jgi:hypothetical protein
MEIAIGEAEPEASPVQLEKRDVAPEVAARVTSVPGG